MIAHPPVTSLIPRISARDGSIQTNERLNLLLVLLGVLVDLEVSERVGVLGGSDDSEEVLKVVLLEVLLREVLEVSLGEGDVGGQDESVAWY